jgi:hypothetical protein
MKKGTAREIGWIKPNKASMSASFFIHPTILYNFTRHKIGEKGTHLFNFMS